MVDNLTQYNKEHCDPDMTEYVGQILIMKPETMCEEFQNTQYQLWLATHGTGCFSWSEPMSDTIHAVCLTDNDYGAFSRVDFYGVANEDILPPWALEKREHLLNPPEETEELDR